MDVVIKLQSGKQQSLVSGLRQPEQAQFIEQQLEERLGIVDRRMVGELPPM